jgi:hypothetical protein
MANTTIQISGGADGAFSVSPNSASFNAGDTLKFVSSAGTPNALICFSDPASVVISPASDDPFPISAGSTLNFSVTKSGGAGCGVTVDAADGGGIPEFPDAPAGVLEVATVKSRPVPTDPTQGDGTGGGS